MLLSIFLSIFYFSLFTFIIYRASFFSIEGFSRRNITLIFLLKIFFGIALLEIYSHYYKVRIYGDAFKYYDDAKIIYSAFYTHPWDYVRITFGINSDSPELFHYYEKMNNWFLADDYTPFNDSRSVIRFNALVFPFSFGKYVVHMIFMCFISLAGLVALFKVFQKKFPQKVFLLAVAIFLVPSVLFWGSGVLKEGLILFASGFLVYFFFRFLEEKKSYQNLLGFCVFCLLMVAIKVHILFSLFPGFIILYWHSKTLWFSIYKKTFLVGLSAILFSLVSAQLSQKHNPFHMLAQKQKDFVNLAKGGIYFEKNDALKDTFYVAVKDVKQIFVAADSVHWQLAENTIYYKWTKGDLVDTLKTPLADNSNYKLIMKLDSSGSKISLQKLEPTLWSVFKNIPSALLNSLIRPTIFEAKNFLSLFAALENLLISILVLVCFLFFKKPTIDEQTIFIFCSSFVFILFSIAGLTTPVLGALVRYKIPALPYLFIVFIILTDDEKLQKRFPFLKKIMPQ